MTTPNPVDALMELVVDLEQAAHAGASFPRILSLRAAVEASARALAAVPAPNHDQILPELEALMNSNRISPSESTLIWRAMQALSTQQAGGVPAGFVLAGWLREWEGDESDIGQWLFVEHEHEKDDSPNWHPVYWLAAPSPSAVQPLSEAQIKQMWLAHERYSFDTTLISPIVFARAIEAAHGIVTPKEPA